MIELRPILGSPEKMLELQAVLEEAPKYSVTQTGHPPGKAEAQSVLTALPPDRGYEDKFVFGVYLENKMIGCVDIIRSYPDSKTAMLGLLLLSEDYQGRGFGSSAYLRAEEVVGRWAGCEKIRIGITRTNDKVISFWKKMGFEDTGVRRPYSHGKLTSETLVFEKKIIPQKRRYTMRAELTVAQVEPLRPTRQLRVGDAEIIGKLQERAYRGTIDDEGEATEQFIQETRATLEGKYGPFISDASFWISENDKAISATIITIWKDKPLLAFSVTEPSHQRKGLAEFLIRKSMKALAELGYPILELGVTNGNPAQGLYEKLGFKIVPRD